jgi:hypothetical protein
MRELRKKRARITKKTEQENKAVKRPEVYLRKLVRAEELDRSGKLLPIYKRLGGPQVGRHVIENLKGKKWASIDPATRKTISCLVREHPL